MIISANALMSDQVNQHKSHAANTLMVKCETVRYCINQSIQKDFISL